METILSKNATETKVNSNPTHVLLGRNIQYWKLNKYLDFWVEYCRKIKNRKNTIISKYTLAEKISNESAIFVNFHFRFDQDVDHSKISPLPEDFLIWLAYAIQAVTNSVFNITSSNAIELLTVVLESKEPYTDGKFTAVDVRCHLPYARIDNSLYRKIVRPQLINFLSNYSVDEKLDPPFNGKWNDIITKKNDYLTMYGCSEPGIPQLSLRTIWGLINPEDEDQTEEDDDIVLVGKVIDSDTIFDPYLHKHMISVGIDTAEERFEEENLDLKDLLPIFLSLDYRQNLILPFPAAEKNKTDSEKTRVFNQENENDNTYVYRTRLDLVKHLLTMVSINRFLNEANWLEFGKIFYTVTNGSKQGLTTWVKYTEKALVGVSDIPPFIKNNPNIHHLCDSFYQMFFENSLDEKTIGWYAKIDSADKYQEWHDNWSMGPMAKALSLNDYHIAGAFAAVFWLDFICASVSKHQWFKFSNHRWIEDDGGITITNCMSEEFVEKYRKCRMTLDKQASESNSKEFKTSAESTIKKIDGLIFRLLNDAPKSRILRQLKGHFYDSNFLENLNSNDYLTGVVNGVLEGCGSEIIFRAAKPQDYLSKSTRVPYRADYHWKHPLVIETMEWLQKVFVRKGLLEHFLKFGASGLIAGNIDKIFAIWTGSGNNSKSAILKLFECTFGSYLFKLPVTIFSEKAQNSGSATPQLARGKDARFAFADEPDDKDDIQKGVLKRYTGGDSFFARLLHDNGGDIKATFKIVLMCNNVPCIANADQPTKDRVKFFPFLSTFVVDAPETKEEQFEKELFSMDTKFGPKIPKLASAFLWILVEFYPHYIEEGIVDPPSAIEATESYWRDNDIYAQYMSENIQIVKDKKGNPDKSVKIHFKEIWDNFREWFRDNFEGKIPQRNIVSGELSGKNRLGRRINNCFYGVRIVEDGESEGFGQQKRAKINIKNQEEQTEQTKIEKPYKGVDVRC